METQEDHSNPIPALNVDSLKVDLVVIHNTCSEKEESKEDHSNPIPALNVDSLKADLVVIHNTCFEKEESNSETTSSKSVKE
ncbi:hypothetical protein Tco_0338012 [Tanacetum coccineum]